MSSQKQIIDLDGVPPADFSFRKLKTLDAFEGVRPRSLRVRKEITKGPQGKLLTHSLWLNNNSIISMQFLYTFAEALLEVPEKIQWIDLSFNNIESIHEDVLQFPELKILYLHGNCINDLSDIVKLKSLPQLRSLTLHGSPIETVPFYRRHIIYQLPHLRNLDFISVTPSELKAPPPPGAKDVH